MWGSKKARANRFNKNYRNSIKFYYICKQITFNEYNRMMKENSKKSNKNNSRYKMRLFFVLLILFVVAIGLIVVLHKTGIWNKINSVQKIRNIVEKGGVFSFLIFMLLQILQTTILQVPAILVTLSGTLIFGRWKAFVLSFIAVMIGSVLMFVIGRKIGKKFLNFLIGQEKTEKWVHQMSCGKYLFFLMMVFPLFPDDILCVVAGITNMSFKFFIVTNIIARFIGIGCTVFLGTGLVIPFSGWGLIVWGIVLIFVMVIFYLSIKYKDKIDYICKQLFKK